MLCKVTGSRSVTLLAGVEWPLKDSIHMTKMNWINDVICYSECKMVLKNECL